MKTAIVTGASGFIGRAVVQELLSHDYQVYAVVREGSHDKIPKSDGLAFIVCDMETIGALPQKLPKGQYGAFFHIAWEGSAGARGDVALQLKNVQWTVNALHVAKRVGCRRFICAGSLMEREAFFNTSAQGSLPGMGNIYAGAKLLAHIMCKTAAAQQGIDLVWVMLANVYGPGEKSPRLVNTTIRKCLRREAPEFTAGTQNYDFVYIDDAARAFRLIAEKGKPFYEYIIGGSAARPLKDFLVEMQRAVAPDIPFKFGSIPYAGVNLSLREFDCSQTERDTGFRAQVGFAEGCRRTMEWIKSEEAGNENI